MSIDEEFPFTTEDDSIREKDWAAGGLKIVDNCDYVFKLRPGVDAGADMSPLEKYQVTSETLQYSPVWQKQCDEMVVNALDHHIRCLNTATPVTNITLTLERSGWISIYNDGKGVRVGIHETASKKFGRTVYAPELIFGHAFQGSNRVKDSASIVGGTNGLGAKITSVHSLEYIVETCDMDNGLHYTQKWYDGKRRCDPARVTPIAQIPRDQRHGHTKVSFLPNYESFGHVLVNGRLSDEDFHILELILRTRMVHCAAYMHYGTPAKKTKRQVWFNREIMRFYSSADILQCMFPSDQIFSTPLANATHPWEISLAVTSHPSAKELSIVNGIVVNSGKHTKHIYEKFTEGVIARMGKSASESQIKSMKQFISHNCFLLANCKIPNPSWTGQRKDIVNNEIKQFRKYEVPTAFINKCADVVKTAQEELLNTKVVTTGPKKLSYYDKYDKAQLAGTKHSLDCQLLIFEGDSGKNAARAGIVENKLESYLGALCMGGVPMNARLASKVHRTAAGQRVVLSDKLTKNKFFEAFLGITGLNPNYQYDPTSPTFKKEMNALNYGSIVMMVDQDHDGKGNILGSILSTFHLWWPNLIRAGRIKWYSSPIIRAYPKQGSKVVEFYTDVQYNQWAKTTNASSFNLRYYKGLGTHSKAEMINMFKKFKQNLFSFELDKDAPSNFEAYYGHNADSRKDILITPAHIPTFDEQQRIFATKIIPCSHHLSTDTKSYQLDNLERKLNHIIDGQNQAGRKILDGLIKSFTKVGEIKKVAVLAGEISEGENYHHGEASLADSITARGFVALGGMQIPDVVPYSSFGTIAQGGKDASAPRYIFGGGNPITPILYPTEDYDLLEFVADEGKFYEPKFFVPIIPRVCVENVNTLAHGWRINLFARDMRDVLANVRLMIQCPTITTPAQLRDMRPTTYAGAPFTFTGTFTLGPKNKTYSLGKYQIVSRTQIRITALPIGVWYENFCKKLAEKFPEGLIIDIDKSGCGNATIDIRVDLAPGALETIQAMRTPFFDGVVEYLKLRSSQQSHINLMSHDGSVIMLNDYREVFPQWFPFRRALYIKRVERRVIIYRAWVTYYENLLRFIRARKQYGTKKVSAMIEDLTADKFIRIHKPSIERPGRVENSEISNLIFGPNASYDYLLKLSDYKKSDEQVAKYEKNLDKYTALLTMQVHENTIGEFPGAYEWLKNLDEFEKIFIEGTRTEWLFGQSQKYDFE